MSGYIYGRWSKQSEAQQAFRKTMKLKAMKELESTDFILLNISLGNKNEALNWLEKAYERHTPNLNAIRVDPAYDPLRNEPRFHAVMKQFTWNRNSHHFSEKSCAKIRRPA